MLIQMQDYKREVSGTGAPEAPILLVVDHASGSDQYSERPMSGSYGRVYLSQFTKAGIPRSRFRIEAICQHSGVSKKAGFYSLSRDEQNYWRDDFRRRFEELDPSLVIPAGNEACRLLTGKSSLQKWHLSFIKTTEQYRSLPCLPLLSPVFVAKIFPSIAYITHGAERVKSILDGSFKVPERDYLIRPSIDQTLQWIKEAQKDAEWLCADIETAAGLITCIGFSIDPSSAICVPTKMEDYSSAEEFYIIWKSIAEILESPLKKTNQNMFYDQTYLSSYGIRVRNICHDTMPAMRFLHSELTKGLDTVARIYTNATYWKDEAKDWTARQNADELYTYNCKDASETLEATFAQIQDLKERNQYENFQELVIKMLAPFTEMSWNGLPVRRAELLRLREEAQNAFELQDKVVKECSMREIGKEINVRSPAQVKDLLRSMGFKLLKKQGKETSDYESLLKLRLKDPGNTTLEALIKLSKMKKEIDSYLNYRYYEEEERMRHSLYICSTKTWRGSGGTDSWDRGINAQTIPRGKLRGQFGYE